MEVPSCRWNSSWKYVQLWSQGVSIKACEDKVLASHQFLTALANTLRPHSIENVIKQFVTSTLPMKAGVSCASSSLLAKMTLHKGALPMSSEQHVAGVITHNGTIEALARAEKGPSPGVCELSSLVQSASGLQERCPIAAQDVTKFDHMWSIAFEKWLSYADASGFQELHTLFASAASNIENETLHAVPWLRQSENKDITEKMQTYQSNWTHSKTNQHMASSLINVLPSPHREKVSVNLILLRLSTSPWLSWLNLACLSSTKWCFVS